MNGFDLVPIFERLCALETASSETAGRITAKWEARDRQDAVDQDRFHRLEERVGELRRTVAVLSTKIAVFATLGGTASGAAFNFFSS